MWCAHVHAHIHTHTHTYIYVLLFFIQSFFSGYLHLGCFCVLAIVNSAVMSIEVHIYF